MRGREHGFRELTASGLMCCLLMANRVVAFTAPALGAMAPYRQHVAESISSIMLNKPAHQSGSRISPVLSRQTPRSRRASNTHGAVDGAVARSSTSSLASTVGGGGWYSVQHQHASLRRRSMRSRLHTSTPPEIDAESASANGESCRGEQHVHPSCTYGRGPKEIGVMRSKYIAAVMDCSALNEVIKAEVPNEIVLTKTRS